MNILENHNSHYFIKRFLEDVPFLRGEKANKLPDVFKQVFFFDFSGFEIMNCFPSRCIILDFFLV